MKILSTALKYVLLDTIYLIACKGMRYMRHMHSDLMRPARVQPALD